MVTKIIRANITDEERHKILHSVEVLAGEMVKEINRSNYNQLVKEEHNKGVKR